MKSKYPTSMREIVATSENESVVTHPINSKFNYKPDFIKIYNGLKFNDFVDQMNEIRNNIIELSDLSPNSAMILFDAEFDYEETRVNFQIVIDRNLNAQELAFIQQELRTEKENKKLLKIKQRTQDVETARKLLAKHGIKYVEES